MPFLTCPRLKDQAGPSSWSCVHQFQPIGTQRVLVHGIIPFHVKDFALPFTELDEGLVCPFLLPVKVLLNGNTPTWCIGCYSQIYIISRLAEGALCLPLSRSLMNMFSSIGPSTYPWSTPLVNILQEDFVLLITTLSAWQFSQFSHHLTVHLSNPYFISLSIRMLQETVPKALLKSR